MKLNIILKYILGTTAYGVDIGVLILIIVYLYNIYTVIIRHIACRYLLKYYMITGNC